MSAPGPTPCEVALRSRLALLCAKGSGRPVGEEELVASVVAAGYPRELAVVALEAVRARGEAYRAKGGWRPGAPPPGRPPGDRVHPSRQTSMHP